MKHSTVMDSSNLIPKTSGYTVFIREFLVVFICACVITAVIVGTLYAKKIGVFSSSTPTPVVSTPIPTFCDQWSITNLSTVYPGSFKCDNTIHGLDVNGTGAQFSLPQNSFSGQFVYETIPAYSNLLFTASITEIGFQIPGIQFSKVGILATSNLTYPDNTTSVSLLYSPYGISIESNLLVKYQAINVVSSGYTLQMKINANEIKSCYSSDNKVWTMFSPPVISPFLNEPFYTGVVTTSDDDGIYWRGNYQDIHTAINTTEVDHGCCGNWATINVNSPASYMTCNLDTNTYTVRGAGADFYAPSSTYQYQFMYQKIPAYSNLTFIVQISAYGTEPTGDSTDAQAGVSISTALGSPTNNNQWGIGFFPFSHGGQVITTHVGSSSPSTVVSIPTIYFKVTINNSLINMSYSSNGTVYTLMTSSAFNQTLDVYIGPFVTSHTSQFWTVTFTNASLVVSSP